MSEVQDVVATPVRVKEVGSTTVACPMLNSTNYTVWSLRIKVVLKIHKVWFIIETEEKNEEKDNLAMGLLYQAIPESQIMQIGDIDSSKVLCKSIKARYVGADRVKEARLQTLNSEFDRLKMSESESIDNFAGKLSGIASKSAALGESIEESKMVKKFLKSLPRKFIHIVASLEQVLDLKIVGYEDVVGRLKAYEERIREEEDDGGENRVLFADEKAAHHKSGNEEGSRATGYANGKNESSKSNGFIGGGSESGNGSGIGSGGPKTKYEKPNSDLTQSNLNNCNKCNCCCEKNWRNREKDRSKVICFRCDKPGHFASKCPERLQKLQDGDFSGGEDNDETVF